MDGIKKLLSNRVKASKPDTHLHSGAHVLADEICNAFGEPKRFAMYLGTITRVGPDKARQIFRQIQQDGAKTPGRLFMYLCKKKADEDKLAAKGEKKNDTNAKV